MRKHRNVWAAVAAVLVLTVTSTGALSAELVKGGITTSESKFAGTMQVDMKTGTSTWIHDGELPTSGPESAKAVGAEVYRNMTNFTGTKFSALYPMAVIGDRIYTTGTGRLNEISLMFSNYPGGGPFLTAVLRFTLYDASSWPTFPVGYPTTQLGTVTTSLLDFGAGLLPDTYIQINITNLDAQPMPPIVTQDILMTVEVVSYTGTPHSSSSVMFFDPPTIGSCYQEFFVDDGVNPARMYNIGPFGGLPNLGFRLNLSNEECLAPQIAISNGFFPFDTIPLGGTASDSLFITNSGTCQDLTWQIVDAPDGNGPHPWLEISQTSGVLAAGQQVALGLNVDAFELETGQYEASMAIETNDPAQPSVNFLVTMTVYSELGRAQPGVLYATQGYDGSGLLVTIDTATGVATPVGNTRVAGIQGLAISAATSLIQGVGAPFNSDLGRLYTLDGNSGAVIKTGGVANCFQAMAYCGDELFGVMLCGRQRLYTIDPTTGELLSSPGLFPAGMLIVGLACDPTTGILYGAESFSETGAINLHTINTTTGALTLVGPLGLGPDDVIGDIAFDSDGNLFGVTGERITANKLVAINKATGQATVIGLTGIDYLSGLDFGRSVALYRVNVGGAAQGALDLGIGWDEDTNTSPSPYRNQGGNPDSYPSGTLDPSVPATTPPEIFYSERWAPQMFWDFPVGAGRAVEVRLYFKNGYWGTTLPGQRVFNVEIDGVPVLTNYDIVADVGHNVGVMKSFFVVGDGNLDIDFLNVVDNPLVCAIEIRGGAGDTATPVPDGPTPPSARVRLGEAAPNPFNPTTRFSFDLPASGHVTLKVYDALGRRVKTIVDGVRSAGTHEVTFSGERLASGVYFYELRAGGIREVRKMTLLK